MKRKRYTEEKIISILKEHEAGASVPDLSRRHGVADNTVYRWKSKFGGMDVSDAKRLRELEAENRKLKHFLTEAELDKAAMKEIIKGKRRRPGNVVELSTIRRRDVSANDAPTAWPGSHERPCGSRSRAGATLSFVFA